MSSPSAPTVDGSELLTHRGRRQICSVLAESGPLSIPVLAERLVDRRSARAFDDSTDALIALRHNHLPRLRDRGIVVYEPGGERVSITDSVTFEDGDADLVTVVHGSRAAGT